MDINRLADMAQEFVVSTSRIVGGRTINIMDTNGIIVASSSPERIGTFHQGAYEVVQTREMVQIRPEDLKNYPGAREGCNMPIYYKTKLVGVVGIYGEPEDVIETANLLKLYVTQFFKQNAINIRKRSELEIRKQLLNMLTSSLDFSEEECRSLGDSISVYLSMPCRVYIINETSDDNKLKKLKKLEHLLEALHIARVLDNTVDVYGIKDSHLVVVHSSSEKYSNDKYIEKVYRICEKELESKVEMVVGLQCKNYDEIASSYQNLNLFCRGKAGLYKLDDPSCKEKYLIHYLSMDYGNKFIKELYNNLLEGLGESGFHNAMITIETYYNCNHSINKASAKLHIHKNTLLYRLKRIYGLTRLEKEGDFTQELLLKLVLDYYKYLENLDV